jgi:hypothetical protein
MGAIWKYGAAWFQPGIFNLALDKSKNYNNKDEISLPLDE